MMNQQKTKKAGILKYSLIVPLALALVLSSNAETMVNSAKKTFTATLSAVVNPKKETQKPVVTMAQTAKPAKQQLSTVQDSKTTVQQPDNQKIYTVVEKMPQFPGGEKALMEYVSKKLRYPADAFLNGIQGRVIVRFIVSETGKTNQVEVLRSLDPACDKEALRVIKTLPDFIPGEQNNKKVAVWYTLPVTFKINDESADNKKVYTVVEKMPQFPGGEQELLKYFGKNLHYPVEAQKAGTQGRVVIRFVVSETGKVGHIGIIENIVENTRSLPEIVVVGYGNNTDVKPQTPNPNMALLGGEVARVTSTLPDFISGEQNGKKVAVLCDVLVTFKLN